MTLKQVFESMNLTPYDLTIDMLDCHAVRTGTGKLEISNQESGFRNQESGDESQESGVRSQVREE